jgi:hypothetical protein
MVGQHSPAAWIEVTSLRATSPQFIKQGNQRLAGVWCGAGVKPDTAIFLVHEIRPQILNLHLFPNVNYPALKSSHPDVILPFVLSRDVKITRLIISRHITTPLNYGMAVSA